MPCRPSKPIELVKGHRTKKEIEIRKKAEESLLTKSSFKEWSEVKNNPIAHKEFIRLRKALKAISKDDSLYEACINRLCCLHAECKEFEEYQKKTLEDIKELEDQKHEMDFTEYIKTKSGMHKNYLTADGKLMNKRKMILDIEKENVMTIASALRSIPKKEEKKNESKMATFLKNKGVNSGT